MGNSLRIRSYALDQVQTSKWKIISTVLEKLNMPFHTHIGAQLELATQFDSGYRIELLLVTVLYIQNHNWKNDMTYSNL